MDVNLDDLNFEVSSFLERLKAEYFKPEMQLTFIARMPGNPNCHVIISNDSMDGLAEIIALSIAGKSHLVHKTVGHAPKRTRVKPYLGSVPGFSGD